LGGLSVPSAFHFLLLLLSARKYRMCLLLSFSNFQSFTQSKEKNV
jgi:hypothetical protein